MRRLIRVDSLHLLTLGIQTDEADNLFIGKNVGETGLAYMDFPSEECKGQ